MICSTLHQLNELCIENSLQFSASDMIRLACPRCPSTEVCPAMGTDEYESRQQNEPQQNRQ